jgi:hypothetical protein
MMRVRCLIVPFAAVFAASISAGYAGPCSDDISVAQTRIDAMLEAKVAAGPPATPEAMAGTSPQPTPYSMANVEEKMGELSPRMFNVMQQAMLRARAADGANQKGVCEQALAEVWRTLGR